MIRKANLLFCDHEHGTGEVTFPDVKALDGHNLQQHFIEGNSVRAVRAAAKKIGWGFLDGVDYCPTCMDSL